MDILRQKMVTRLPPKQPLSLRSSLVSGGKNFTPVSWKEYFERSFDVGVNGDIFRVYECGKTGPVCFFLHGGGFSALSWAVLSSLLCSTVNCRCVAMDSRGHGDTKTSDEGQLSAETQADDVSKVIQELYKESLPSIILVGHSMGGAVAIHTVAQKLVPTIVGLVVLDVVEGSAMDALTHMQSYLRSRPSSFASIEKAIEYCTRSGQIKNLTSARVSVPGQLMNLNQSCSAVNDVVSSTPAAQEEKDTEDLLKPSGIAGCSMIDESNVSHRSTVANALPPLTESQDGAEESVTPDTGGQPDHKTSEKKYGWRIDLAATEPHWKGWFQGMSALFLSCDTPKLLLLAGVDRLDRDLTVGQMQGKFQLEVMPQCGYAMHEDSPEKVCEAIATFLIRQRLTEAINS